MATSGSVDYIVTGNDIIKYALRVCGLTRQGSTPSTDQVTEGLDFLNIITKSWMTDGLQLWARKKATIFTELNKSEYSLGPSGDHATESYTETALGADAAASATSLTVGSITDISNGDVALIVLDDGTLHVDTVNGAPSGSTVVITTGLASAAATDNACYFYTTKIDRPLRIIEAFTRDSSDNDIPLDIVGLNEYADQADKTTDGRPNIISYDPQLTNGILRIWPQSDDVTRSIEIWYHRPFEDFDAGSDNPDFPQEWYHALVYGLASMFADAYSLHPAKASRIARRAEKYKEEVLDFDDEQGSIFFAPDFNWKGRG